MIPRTAETLVRELLSGFPIVTITGPRQSGKTTLARTVMADRPYRSLEDPDVRALALDDPRGFLSQCPDGAVLDEVQRAPELFSYLQTHVDGDGRMGRFLLTGSQQFGLMSGISQSLAGRSAFVELLPLSHAELVEAGQAPTALDAMMFTGGYPALYDRPVSPRHWFPAYVTAYVERDVRQLLQVQDLDAFQRFVRLCAGRSGQVLNLSSLAADCGITHNTAKAWISVLEASYVLFLLRPHHANFNKRLIKSPKLYFHDTGLLCWLLGVQTPEQLVVHPLRGQVFETYVISELRKAFLNRGEPPLFHFWRDSNGNEVDLLIEWAGGLMPVEIKSGQTLNRDFFTGLERWTALAGDMARLPTLIYGGEGEHQRKAVRVLGWDGVGEVVQG
ncbi:AAA family ATPase [Thioalkalivibrio sp. K90mix]|uniref:ATP-binding protein n=1 Tax=Thioalkalivibrio sp. (strain K90mix) TaxID=396595 RepID=UPI000195A663|nr:ATP-binding protein [Thioalkalivibrio sp. K90mix]ADC72040.1 AAA family ATPase [Thioalkalivibrio sp. K90mix]